MKNYSICCSILFFSLFASFQARADYQCCERIYCEKASSEEQRRYCESIPFGPELIGGVRRVCGVRSSEKSEAISTYNENCRANDNNIASCWWHRDCRSL